MVIFHSYSMLVLLVSPPESQKTLIVIPNKDETWRNRLKQMKPQASFFLLYFMDYISISLYRYISIAISMIYMYIFKYKTKYIAIELYNNIYSTMYIYIYILWLLLLLLLLYIIYYYDILLLYIYVIYIPSLANDKNHLNPACFPFAFGTRASVPWFASPSGEDWREGFGKSNFWSDVNQETSVNQVLPSGKLT